MDEETQSAVRYSEAASAVKFIVTTAKNEAIIRVSLTFFGETQPEDWASFAVLLSQEGYPSEGVWRVRDVDPAPAQHLFGGVPVNVNHTHIIDLILPDNASKDQEDWFSDDPSRQEAIDALLSDGFPQIPMLEPGEE